MEFCTICGNMLYIKPQAGNPKGIEYACKNCQFVKPLENPDRSLLVSEHASDESSRHTVYMNKNIKYDPTMPHVDNIPCPHKECPTKKPDAKVSQDVIYMKYDSDNMKYIYFCTRCENFWKND